MFIRVGRWEFWLRDERNQGYMQAPKTPSFHEHHADIWTLGLRGGYVEEVPGRNPPIPPAEINLSSFPPTP